MNARADRLLFLVGSLLLCVSTGLCQGQSYPTVVGSTAYGPSVAAENKGEAVPIRGPSVGKKVELPPCQNEQSPSATWSVKQGGNGHRYTVVHVPEGITWAQAFRKAISLGGHLATITTREENNFIGKLAATSRYWNRPPGWTQSSLGPWIGGFQAEGAKEPDGGWNWVTGEQFAFANWERKGPEPNGSHDCGHSGPVNRICLYSKRRDKASPSWCDAIDCCTHVTSFIVEFDRFGTRSSTAPRSLNRSRVSHPEMGVHFPVRDKRECRVVYKVDSAWLWIGFGFHTGTESPKVIDHAQRPRPQVK